MRMRKVKWAVDYLKTGKKVAANPETLKGSWKSVLGCEKLHVEIGCGKGNYSLTMAQMVPEQGFVAVEKNESAAGIAAKKFDEAADIHNLMLIHGDAAEIQNWFDPGEVDFIHLNFSDPWPKKRNAKRRLSSSSFLQQYIAILSKDGQVQMKTDNKDLFEYSIIEFQNAGFTMLEISVDYRRNEHKEDAVTEYEEKFIAQNMPIYRCVWKYQGVQEETV